MRSHRDCIPCLEKQALRAAAAGGADEAEQRMVLRMVREQLASMDWTQTPMAIGMRVHRLVRELTGVHDPFEQAKVGSTQAALASYRDLRQRVRTDPDPLRMAVRLAIAGNIMDLGALDDFDLYETLDRVMDQEFAVDDFDKLAAGLGEARTLLLFADNAGETVLDRLLIETILERRRLKIGYVVKSGPLINDATARDADRAGFSDLRHVDILRVSNGDDDHHPEYGSAEVAGWIADNDVVISKGQGNYEALSEYPGIFYMLMAKCPVIAASVGVGVGDIVLQLR